MNDNDIKKCKKNGYVWLDNCGIILRVNNGSCLWPEKNQWGMLCFHATRAAAQAAIDERVAKRKADAAHAKMLEDGKHQTTPITPEQAKMLRVGDEFFYLQHGGGAPKYHVTLDKLKRSPDITKWKCFVNGLAYFTHEAALAAIDERVAKRKADRVQVSADTEPPMWEERKHGDVIQAGDIVTYKLSLGLDAPCQPIGSYSRPDMWEIAVDWVGKTVDLHGWQIRRACFESPAHVAWRKRQEANEAKEVSTDETQKPREWTDIPQPLAPRNDPVNHPAHYTSSPSGIECIQVTEHMNFCRGNAVKYVWRAGEKGDEIEDLKKARWYLDREIARLEKAKEQND